MGADRIPNINNVRFGSLLVIREIGWKNNKYLWECRCSCGNKIQVSHSKLVTKKTISCGCDHKKYHSYTERRKTALSEARNTKEYKRFCSNVIARDKGICQSCGSTTNIQVHHICSVMHNQNLITDMDNGVCLCKKCHKEFHVNFMGGFKKECNKNDLQLWMETR